MQFETFTANKLSGSTVLAHSESMQKALDDIESSVNYVKTEMKSRIKQRSDVLSNWLSNNPVLLSGELAVVDCGTQIRFKIGDGERDFKQLKFTDEDQLSTKVVYANAIGQGTANVPSPFGLAAGFHVSAIGNYSQAFGYKANAISGDEFSFVWNGDLTSPINSDWSYKSHGPGSFNVNSPNGIEGIWIGEKNLKQILDTVDPMRIPVQMIRPAGDENMYLSVSVFGDKEMTSANVILPAFDSRLKPEFFSYFRPNGNYSQWIECGADGFPREAANLPALFDLPKAFESLSVDVTASRLYVRYAWYKLNGADMSFSDIYTMTLPAATEVGANSQDVVSKNQFAELKQNVIKESDECGLSAYGAVDYYMAYSTKYCMIANRVVDGDKIALMDYDEHKTYKVDFSTGPDDAQIEFYVGLANGNIEYADKLNSEYHNFKKNRHYLLQICDSKIFVYDGDAVYASTESGGGTGGTYRYPLVTAELQKTASSSLSCAIQDHSVTTIGISSAATPIIVQLPHKQDGARDFIIRIEISSPSAPSFTFSGLDENITFDSDDESWYVLQPGLNLVSFTETRA